MVSIMAKPVTVQLTPEEVGLLGELLWELAENEAVITGGVYKPRTRYVLKARGYAAAHGLLGKVSSPGGEWKRFFKKVKKA